MQNVQENELHVQQEMIENADLFLAVTLMLCRLQNRILEILVKWKKNSQFVFMPPQAMRGRGYYVFIVSRCPRANIGMSFTKFASH